MKEYKRDYPLFSLCGLCCGLCPRYQTDAASKCPGCGGEDFALKHPSCAVITCSKKHGDIQYCFQCAEYPCGRYARPGDADSFISYRNVRSDMDKAARDLQEFKRELDAKVEIVEFLIKNYNDGKRKSFYCNAANLLTLADLKEIMKEIENSIEKQDIPVKEKIEKVVAIFIEQAEASGLDLKLRR